MFLSIVDISTMINVQMTPDRFYYFRRIETREGSRLRTLNAKCNLVSPGWLIVITHREAPSPSALGEGSLVIVNCRAESGETSTA